jgi:hypothetical protein
MGSAFVDDTSLGVTFTYPSPPDLSLSQVTEANNSHMIQQLQALAQHWERLLYTTGGAINLQKKFWYLLAWTWKDGVPSLSSTSKAPGDLQLTSGSSQIYQTVPHIAPTDAFRTLGVYIAPNGSQTKQVHVLRGYLEEYSAAVSVSTLTPAQAYCSYTMYL